MQGRVANCPSCGGGVEFKADHSIVSVCPYCSTAVARTGGDIGELEIAGKVAPLADIGSPLSIGLDGKLQGKGFRLVGRIQLDYGEGPWNEWYAAFDDGRWAWVAEAQGRVYFTMKQDVPDAPTYNETYVGATVTVRDFPLAVVERRSAEFVSAEGELPTVIKPGERYFYADLEGEGGVFGTLDFGNSRDASPEVFVGRRQEYTDLFSKTVLSDRQATQAQAAGPMNCPNCGGGIELQAPDEAKRITCSHCDSTLDCSDKSQPLKFLEAATPLPSPPMIPVGARGKFRGKKYTVYGYMLRAALDEEYDGSWTEYPWHEFLLRDEKSGSYSWLACSNGHWSWVDSTPPPALGPNWMEAVPDKIKLADTEYRRLSQYESKVKAIRGEFYWKVKVDEFCRHAEFIAPPKGLSVELTEEEVNWSLAEALSPEQVQEIFPKDKLELPAPQGIGTLQINPYKKLRWKALAASLLLAVIGGYYAGKSSKTPAFKEDVPLVPISQNGSVTSGEPQRWKVQLPGGVMGIQLATHLQRASHEYGMLYAVIKLDDGKGGVRTAGVQLAVQRGGDATRTVYMGGLDAGEYILEVTPQWPKDNAIFSQVILALYPSWFFGGRLVFFLVLLWIYPAWNHFARLRFEANRGE